MLTSNELIKRVLRRCYWPTNTSTGLGQNAPLSDADLLAIADEDLLGELYPQLIAADADYSLATLNYAITAAQEYYRVPLHTYGAIKDLLEVQTTGAELAMSTFKLEDLGRPDRLGFTQRAEFSVVVDGDFFRLNPVPTNTSKTFRIRYYHTPSKLALLATSATIAARSTVTVLGIPVDRLTLSADLSVGDTVPTLAVDCLSSAGAHQLLAENAAASVSAAGPYAAVTVASGGWGQAAIGDYIAPTGYTPIVQIPDLMEALFIQRVTCSALRAKKDYPALDREMKIAERLEKQAQKMLVPRSKAEPDYVITRNSVLRQGVSFRRIW